MIGAYNAEYNQLAYRWERRSKFHFGEEATTDATTCGCKMLKEYRVKSKNNKNTYTVYVDEEKNYTSCTCVHGSLYRFSERAKGKNETCYHIKEIKKCLELKKKLECSA